MFIGECSNLWKVYHTHFIQINYIYHSFFKKIKMDELCLETFLYNSDVCIESKQKKMSIVKKGTRKRVLDGEGRSFWPQLQTK